MAKFGGYKHQPQPHSSPDFRIQNKLGGTAWVEAVTANSIEPYNHVNAPTMHVPQDPKELLIGGAAVRFAKTLGNKLSRQYHQFPHVSSCPFIIALADFHGSGFMVWSREALVSYLYGTYAELINVNGNQVAFEVPVLHLLGKTKFPAGLFCNEKSKGLSAVIFSNACSVAKFNRVGVSAGAATKYLRYVRMGKFFDRRPDSFDGIPFCMDVSSNEYRKLWPQGYEPWSAELEVFHNPFARHPTPHELLPETTHWYHDMNNELVCNSHYKTSILWSKTLIQNSTDRMPKVEDFI